MALIVENGTGLVNADSMASVAELDAYLSAHGLAAVADVTTKEVALRLASEYADTVRRYKGTTLSPSQAFMFPREGLTDWSGHVITGVPVRLKNGVLFLASQVLAGEALYENITAPEVASESVGAISVSYVAGSNRHKAFTTFDRLVAQYVRPDNQAIAVPGWSPPEGDNAFSIGMHDFATAPLDEVE